MAKRITNNDSKSNTKKEVKAEIIGKLKDALREYRTPKFEKKLLKKIRKAGKSITPVVVKSKRIKANVREQKPAQ